MNLNQRAAADIEYIQSVQGRMDRIHKVYMEKMGQHGRGYNMSTRPSPGEMFITEKMNLVNHYLQADVIGEDRKIVIDFYLKEAEVFLNIDIDNVPLPTSFVDQAAVAVSLVTPEEVVQASSYPLNTDVISVRYCLNTDVVGYKKFDIDQCGVDDTTAFQINASKKDPVFLDILHKVNKYVWEVKLYFPDGTVIPKCYILPHALDVVKIHNLELLFDGRFNA